MLEKKDAVLGKKVKVLGKTVGVDLNKLGCAISTGDVLTLVRVVGNPWDEESGFIKAYKVFQKLEYHFAPRDLEFLPEQTG